MTKFNVYDFDKTLYKKDASLEFWKYCVKKNKLLLLLLPYQVIFLIMNKLKIVSTKLFKQEFFAFLRFIKKENIDKNLIEFWDNEFKNMNLEVMSTLKVNEFKNICISASPKFILEIPCKRLDIELLIGTTFDLNKFKIIGQNCKGKQKIIDLNKHIQNYSVENFYSDSYSDLPLFEIAQNKYLIKNNKIKEINNVKFVK